MKHPVNIGAPALPGEQDNEFALFRDAVADVLPVRVPGKALLEKPRPKPIPSQLLRDDREVLKEALSDPLPGADGFETSETSVFVRPGLPKNVVRRLRNGHWSVRYELDLHGYTGDEARTEFVAFLNRARRDGERCVRIVHGKGLRSPTGEPVLKQKVRHWLTQRDEILAFVEAAPAQGGSGAVVVLLKSKAPSPQEFHER
ncbi:MAG: Smr/MutS family protein [Pseudomonadota bacterium]|nr:Smr/MutS family protein [Pseudomonadota bacterium]